MPYRKEGHKISTLYLCFANEYPYIDRNCIFNKPLIMITCEKIKLILNFYIFFVISCVAQIFQNAHVLL